MTWEPHRLYLHKPPSHYREWSIGGGGNDATIRYDPEAGTITLDAYYDGNMAIGRDTKSLGDFLLDLGLTPDVCARAIHTASAALPPGLFRAGDRVRVRRQLDIPTREPAYEELAGVVVDYDRVTSRGRTVAAYRVEVGRRAPLVVWGTDMWGID